METEFTEKDFYAQHFVPKQYLENYYCFRSGKDAENSLLTTCLQNLHKVFSLDGIKGDTLIDIGSGPTIHQFLSACESFREIVASDYTDQNREEMQRWLRKEPDAFDWSPMVQYVCELEGDREKWARKEEQVRRAITQVLKCDVTLPNPLAPLTLPPADCLLSSLCLEGACKDLSVYRSAVRNISSLLKPGGHLVLFGVLEETFYMVGQHQFSCLYLEQKDVEEAVREAGLRVQWVKEARMQFSPSVSDLKGVFTLVAQKHCS
ncbi:nicotinamide N-methyltransferase-like [Hemicordylus capensis]|uniref:nicotinamide N-methyltransferase-like n=1 Tax=Hemicordylus capensis TaxID=884348 RepID=UPI002302C528|nr:nicotinamide N-methyltransferase-like [Hemicordylus capensis]